MRWCRIGEQNRSRREGNHMKSNLADQGSVDSRNLDARRKQDEIRHNKVKWRPDRENEAERAKRSKVADHKWEQPKLSNHRVDSLHGEHKTDLFGRECQAARELEWKSHGVIRLGCAQEDRHKLVEGNTMAIKLSAFYHTAAARRKSLLCEYTVGNDGDDDLLCESLLNSTSLTF